MKREFRKNDKNYAVFDRPYGFAVYIRENGEIIMRIGGFTEEELQEEFPEAF